VKSPKAGELTGSTWIKLPKMLKIIKGKGITLQKMDWELNQFKDCLRAITALSKIEDLVYGGRITPTNQSSKITGSQRVIVLLNYYVGLLQEIYNL
jgi:hypothetical protein